MLTIVHDFLCFRALEDIHHVVNGEVIGPPPPGTQLQDRLHQGLGLRGHIQHGVVPLVAAVVAGTLGIIYALLPVKNLAKIIEELRSSAIGSVFAVRDHSVQVVVMSLFGLPILPVEFYHFL